MVIIVYTFLTVNRDKTVAAHLIASKRKEV